MVNKFFFLILLLALTVATPAFAGGAGYSGPLKGGSGTLPAPGADGNVLTSDGAGSWVSEAPSGGGGLVPEVPFTYNIATKHMGGHHLVNTFATTFTQINGFSPPTVATTGGSVAAATTAGPSGNLQTLRYQTGTTTNQFCSLIAAATLRSREYNPAILYIVRTSHNTNVRYWIGWSNGDLAAISNPTATQVAAFRFDTAVDTTWKAVTANGIGGVTVTDTGISIENSNVHKFAVRMGATAGTNDVKFYYDGSLVATNSANLPASNLQWNIACTNLASAMREMYILRIYYEYD